MRALHTLIFVLIASCVVFAQNDSLLYKDSAADSSQIYEELIKQEDVVASGGHNVAGIVWGGIFTVTGGVFLGLGINVLLDNYHPETWDDVGDRIGGGLLIVRSIPLLLIGIPVLSYNIYKYNERKGHANKRDEYQRSLDSYNQRRGTSGSIKMSLFPSLDFFNGGGGLNLLMQF